MWEHERIDAGRRKGHENLLWAGTGTWDFKVDAVINFNRAYIFDGELTKDVVLTKNSVVHRYIPLKFAVSEIEKFEKTAKKMMKRYVVQALVSGEVGVPFSDESFRVMEVKRDGQAESQG